MTLDAMPTEIEEISVGGSGAIESLIVTENGTYTPPEGVDGYSPVEVMVTPEPSDIDALIDRSITEITSGVVKVGDGGVFSNCLPLKTANFPNATYIGSSAFAMCWNLETIFAPNITQIQANAFDGCSELTAVNFPKVESLSQEAFDGCKKIQRFTFPNVVSVSQKAFSYCSSLKIVDFSKSVMFAYNAFSYCGTLTSVILRSETACNLSRSFGDTFWYCYHFFGTVNATYNPEGLKDGYIYVPAALVEEYKAATNWSAYPDRFRALEDYTVDGTITGELDETKI